MTLYLSIVVVSAEALKLQSALWTHKERGRKAEGLGKG